MQIFISHSKRDEQLLDEFTNAFSSSTVKAFLAEFEKEFETSKEIKTAIQDSKALFLLLSPSVLYSQYTENWVSWEVGVASEAGKDVWVFEDPKNPVEFPVPTVKNYVPYDSSTDTSFQHVKKIINRYKSELSATLLAAGLGAFLGGSIKGQEGAFIGGLIGGAVGPSVSEYIQPTFFGEEVTCPHPNCEESYILRGSVEEFLCPVCRQKVTYNPHGD